MTDRPGTLVHDCLIDEAGGQVVAENTTGYITIENMSEPGATFILAPGSHIEGMFIAPLYRGWTWYRIRRNGPFSRLLMRLMGFRRFTHKLKRWRT